MIENVVVYLKDFEVIKKELGFKAVFEPCELIYKKEGYPNILSGMEKFFGKGILILHQTQINDLLNGNVFTANGYIFHIDYIKHIKFTYNGMEEISNINIFKKIKMFPDLKPGDIIRLKTEHELKESGFENKVYGFYKQNAMNIFHNSMSEYLGKRFIVKGVYPSYIKLEGTIYSFDKEHIAEVLTNNTMEEKKIVVNDSYKNVKAGDRYKLNTGNNILIVRTDDVTKYTVIDLTDNEVILFESSWYEVIGFLYVCEAVKITKA